MDLRRALLGTAGAVAVAAGTQQLVRGSSGVHAAPPVDRSAVGQRNLDSELRFYSVWYAVAGLQMLRAARGADPDTSLIATGWAGAVVARLLSARSTGRPSGRFMALTAAEAALAVALRPRR